MNIWKYRKISENISYEAEMIKFNSDVCRRRDLCKCIMMDFRRFLNH